MEEMEQQLGMMEVVAEVEGMVMDVVEIMMIPVSILLDLVVAEHIFGMVEAVFVFCNITSKPYSLRGL